MVKRIFRWNEAVLQLIIVCGTIAVYWPSLGYGFSQDDFIHLTASIVRSPLDVLQFFNPFHHFADIFFYRPLATQLYFYVLHTAFGLTPLPFHIVALACHCCNALLGYWLVNKLFHSKLSAFLAGLFYGTAAIHFLSLYFISSFQEILHTTFLLLALCGGLAYIDTAKRRYQAFAAIAFTASLLAKETAIVLPFLWIVLLVFYGVSFKKACISSWLLWLIALVYVCLRFAGLQTVFQQGGYGYAVSPGVLLQNGKWYALWSSGLPEILDTYPKLSLASGKQFAADFWLAKPLLIATGVVCSMVVLQICLTIRRQWRRMLFALLFGVIALVPVLFLTEHRYPQYLDIPYLLLLPVFFLPNIPRRPVQRVLLVVLVPFFLLVQVCSLAISEQSHWVTHRALIASFYQQQFKKTYPTLPNNTTVMFVGAPQAQTAVAVALAYQDAVKLWYPHQVRQVLYEPPAQATGLPQQGTVVMPLSRY